MSVAYISLGSNMGDKVDSLKQAVALLNAHEEIKVTAVSSVYDTDPVGYEDQDLFMNIAVAVETTLSPVQLLDFCQSIEEELKRVRIIRWGPRTMDLDIVLFDDQVMDTERLIIPHPRMHERGFVLVPLAEITMDLVHPVLNKSIEALLPTVDHQGVRKHLAVKSVDAFINC